MKSKEKEAIIHQEIENIKKSNLVKNFSSEIIPDEVYFYLALGSTFCPTAKKDKHDYNFDAKEFF